MLIRLALLGLPFVFMGCVLDTEFKLTHTDLKPVMMDKPKTRLVGKAAKELTAEVKRICRGERGGVLVAIVTNQGERAVEFHPRSIGVQLSSGYRHRFMTASEFEQMCAEFGGSKYGIREEDQEAASQWTFPEEDARFVLEPGQKKEIALAFGAQPEEAWLTLDFQPALKRVGSADDTLLLAVALPDVLPPKKAWLPPWLNFNFAVSN